MTTKTQNPAPAPKSVAGKQLPAPKSLNGHDVTPSNSNAKLPEIAAKTGSLLPSMLGASPELIERMNEVKENLESVDNFRLPRAKMTAGGLELIEGETPILELEGVIVHTKKTNVYYDKPFNPKIKAEPPRCYSKDGITPEADLKNKDGQLLKPIHPTCKGCPMAEFGTNSMKSGKACRNLKPVYLLLSDQAIMPRMLTITPASLKLANQYLLDLTEQGINYRKVKTHISLFKDDPKDTYFKLKFTKGAKLAEQGIKDVEFLKNQWLPVMNNQVADQSEFVDNAQAAPVQDPNGEY